MSKMYQVKYDRNYNCWIVNGECLNRPEDNGGYRSVFCLQDGNFFKVDSCQRRKDSPCYAQTEREVRVLRQIKPKHRKYFPTLIETGYTVNKHRSNVRWAVVAPVTITCKPVAKERTNLLLYLLAKLYEIGDVYYTRIGQEPENNWYVVDDRPVIYDLGWSQLDNLHDFEMCLDV